ncbi:MAG: type IV pilin N-terminal domain-containing protein [bacterium]
MNRFRGDPDGVSDVVGSILLVAITVIMAGLLALLIFAFKGPAPTLQSDLAVSVDPGAGGWGTGDEAVRIQHRGGDALDAAAATVGITIGSTVYSFQGTSQLGSAWGDGKLTIGETWQHTFTIDSGASLSVNVVTSSAGTTRLLSGNTLVASAISTTQPCLTDTVAPTVAQWLQSPATLTAFTTGPVTITVQLTDDCWGVNPSGVPDLFWRITPTTAYTDEGAMTATGLNRWTSTIPAQTWSSLVGKTVQYHVGPLADLGGNTANSPDQASLVLTNCATDNIAPTVQTLTQNPADVRTTTTGAVTITLVATDDCAGVSQTTNPHLLYRFNSGGNQAYTDGGAMTLTATSTWQGTIPSQSWALFVGSTIEYYVSGFLDANGNSGSSTVQQDPVDAVYTYNYVNSNTPTTGTVSAFANAQSASDAGLEATLQEAGTSGSPVTVTFNANGVALGTGWSSATNAFASDNAYATYATAAPTTLNDLKLELQDPSVTTGTITGVVLHAEVSIQGYSNDAFTIYACFTGTVTCDALSTQGGQSSSDVTMNYDISSLRPGGGSWSWTDISNLQGVVNLVQSGSKDGTWRVDRVWVDVTSVTTTYTTSIQFGWTGVAAGTTHTLDIKHRVTGDTFNVQVCQDALVTCVTWTTRGSTLSSGSSTTYTYALTTLEYNAGAPRIRFTDVSPTGTTQGNLFIDYARVDTL